MGISVTSSLPPVREYVGARRQTGSDVTWLHRKRCSPIWYHMGDEIRKETSDCCVRHGQGPGYRLRPLHRGSSRLDVRLSTLGRTEIILLNPI